jgi:hypothetical protein
MTQKIAVLIYFAAETWNDALSNVWHTPFYLSYTPRFDNEFIFFNVEREEQNHALVGLLGRAGHRNYFILVSHWLLSMWNLKVRQ